jgi:hypothetical protein
MTATVVNTSISFFLKKILTKKFKQGKVVILWHCNSSKWSLSMCEVLIRAGHLWQSGYGC